MRSGGCPAAGSSRTLRLDPFALPVQFAARDAVADDEVRHVELHRERVIVRRAVRGVPMALNMPLSEFRGVALRIMPYAQAHEAFAAVVLEHEDSPQAVPLYVAATADNVMAEWRAWGNALDLPLLVTEADGSLREPFARLGHIRVERPRPRRRRRSALKARRPSASLRRKAARITGATPVHRDEREIIARD
jgi:hypothetical protein